MKSKIFAVAAFAFAFAFAFTASAVGASEIYTPTSGFLKVGSGMGAMAYQAPNVMAAQKALNACLNTNIAVDGKYGPITAQTFKNFQISKSLKIDGVIGNETATALAACSGGTSTTPSTGSTTLSGGAGDATITTTSTDVEDSVKEGDSENVLGFQVEADGSDINVSNVKVVFQNDGYTAPSSEKFTNYVDTVSIMMGDKEVGSADASDFTRDSSSPDTFTKTISLSNAVVDEDKKVKFYVHVEAVSNIDTDDLDANWNVALDTVRYNDATGAILSDSPALDENFSFEDESTDDDLSIKSSSANPLAATLMVEEDNTSDKFLVGAFKLDVDDQSSDITLNEMTVVLNLGNYDVDGDADVDGSDDSTADSAADQIVDSVEVKIGSDTYDADLDAVSIANGSGTATYIVDIDGDTAIDAGDDAEVKIYVTFNDQDGNYNAGATVYASVAGSAVDAEGSDELNASGSFTGKTHTLSVNAPTFELVSKSLALYQAVDGVSTGEEDVFLAKFVFNVTAGDEDVYLSRGVEGDAGYTDYVSFTQLGGGDIDSQTLEAEDESIDDGLTSSFLISSGDTEKFTLSFFVRGNNESEKFTINGFSYGSADDTASAYVYASDVTSGLSSFATNTVYLAK